MVKSIASPANPKFKALLKLAQSPRARRQQSKALLDGIHLIEAYRTFHGAPALLAVSADARDNPEIHALLQAIQPVEPLLLSDSLFAKLSSVESPTGIIGIIDIPQVTVPNRLGTCLLLEDIQDPGNLGSILRSAAAAGVQDVFLSGKSTDAWSSRTLRAGMGAHFALRIHERSDLVAIARSYQGKVMAASQKAKQSLFDADLSGPIAFTFGNEGGGLSQPLSAAAGLHIAIPMAKGTESLNVAAAAAVCLFEWVRKTIEDK